MDSMKNNYVFEGHEVKIYTPQTPKPWYNYFWNHQFLSGFSQNAMGYAMSQDSAGYRVQLITARMLYLIDAETQAWWSVNGLPIHEMDGEFQCTHGLGYSRISLIRHNIQAEWTAFVPAEETSEIWSIKMTNLDRVPKTIKVIPFFDTALHDQTFPMSTHGEFDPTLNAILGSNVQRTGSWYDHETMGEKKQGFFTCDRPVSGYDCSKLRFLGHAGTTHAPLGLMQHHGCQNTPCKYEYNIFALEVTLVLQPGESTVLHTIAGVYQTTDQIATQRQKFFSEQGVDREFNLVTKRINQDLLGIEIGTPDSLFNRFYNFWLKHQVRCNSLWARSYYNGFRDLCQDAANLVILDQEAAHHIFRRVLSHQHTSGNAPRAWCEGQLIEQNYADSAVWITFAAYRFYLEQGDLQFLDENIPFWEGENASLYDHLLRSLKYLWNDRGEHGLSRIHSGDWNDVLNGVGIQGRGESVWLSMALLKALREFVILSDKKDDRAGNQWALQGIHELSLAIENHGWNGQWYRRAFTDSGQILGEVGQTEAACFLNPQVWAVLSGAATGERAAAVMQVVDERLETDIGIKTMDSPFTSFKPEVGFLSVVTPGANVNAGIYLHANMFKIQVDCLLKRNEAAFRTLEKILPFSKYREPITGAPYFISNSYLGSEIGYRYNEPGGHWFTGSAGWLLRVVVTDMFGVKPEPEGLTIDPCLPPHWEHCSVTRHFRGAQYEVEYVQTGEGSCNNIEKIFVDGAVFHDRYLPFQKGKRFHVQVFLTP